MKETPRYSVKQYLFILVASSSAGLVIGAIMLSFIGDALGFGIRAVLIMILISFPIVIFIVLYAFYGVLARYFGFEGEEKLFFRGRF